MCGASTIEMVVGKKSVEVSGVRFQVSGVRFQVSGFRCQDEHRSVRKSRAGLCARRIRIIAYYRLRSAQRLTLLILAVPET